MFGADCARGGCRHDATDALYDTGLLGMVDADGGILFCLVHIRRAGVGLAGNVQGATADDRAAACRDAEFGKGHFHRHDFVLFIYACAGRN